MPKEVYRNLHFLPDSQLITISISFRKFCIPMSGSKFRVGDPVWAKMKGFSPWPGKVCLPPAEVKRPAIKKQMHCVNFFGSNDFAWIEENNMKDYMQYKVD